MITLNRSLPFGTVCGQVAGLPGLCYEQGRFGFNSSGEPIFAKGDDGAYVPFDQAKHGQDPEEAKPVIAAPPLSIAAKAVEEAKAAVESAEEELEKAKARPVDSERYTEECAAAQKKLTAAKAALTKAVNAANSAESAGKQ